MEIHHDPYGRLTFRHNFRHNDGMTATIDGAGRIVIPKALRDRAGLAPGTRVDFHFRDGSIEISPTLVDVEWEQVGRVQYPLLGEDGLTTEEIRDLIESGRDAGH